MSTVERKSIGIFKLLGPVDSVSSGQEIIFIRNGETLSEVFPDWTEDSQLDEGIYLPIDLNIPVTLPKRSNLKAAYKADPPISEIGKIVSKCVAGELHKRISAPIKQIYSSPSLACLQTVEAIESVFKSAGVKEINLTVSKLLATDGSSKKHWMANPSGLKSLGISSVTNFEDDLPISKSELNGENITHNIRTFLKTFLVNRMHEGPVIVVCDSIAMAVVINEVRRETFELPIKNTYEKCLEMFPASSTFVCVHDSQLGQLVSPKAGAFLRPITGIGISSSIKYNS